MSSLQLPDGSYATFGNSNLYVLLDNLRTNDNDEFHSVIQVTMRDGNDQWNLNFANALVQICLIITLSFIKFLQCLQGRDSESDCQMKLCIYIFMLMGSQAMHCCTLHNAVQQPGRLLQQPYTASIGVTSHGERVVTCLQFLVR